MNNLKKWLLMLVLALGIHGPAIGGWFSDVIDVDIQIQDEAGSPIPYVTVWGYVVDFTDIHKSMQRGQLTMDDLWRVTTRYQDSFEFAHAFNKPVRNLEVPKMGDVKGRFRTQIDYQDRTGPGNHLARPDNLNFGYSFMKRGYLPAKVEFTLPKNQSEVQATVVLKRDPSQSIETKSYLQTYERIRFEMSDSHKNAEMTLDNAQRLDSLRQQLDATAQEAERAGDKPAAARMYMRMNWWPTIRIANGKVIGYAQTGDDNDPRNRQLGLKAHALDPDATYVWMFNVDTRAKLRPGMGQAEITRAVLAQNLQLVLKKGDKVWPETYGLIVAGYSFLEEFDKAYEALERGRKFEPKYKDWDAELVSLKYKMKSKGKVIPETWQKSALDTHER